MAWLPESLSGAPRVVWRQTLPSDGVGGLAVAAELVLVGGRSADDGQDSWLAFDAATGAPRWEVAYPAAGELDYGNSPRATPLVADGLVYLQGALGQLTCADAITGAVLWQRNLAHEFGTPPLDWGLAGSPLLYDGKIYVQPGGERGSVAALDPYSGETLWATGTSPPGHASLQTVRIAGRSQIVGYDRHSLGGWHPETGERLWTLTPPVSGDFNVPMPLWFDDRWLLFSENNGTRMYLTGETGGPGRLTGSYEPLSPDAHSPVVAGGRVFGVWAGLHCLDPRDGLRVKWIAEQPDFQHYAALLATDERLLCLTLKAELVLIDAAADVDRELGRWSLAEDDAQTLAHPAQAGTRLYVRLGQQLICLELAAER